MIVTSGKIQNIIIFMNKTNFKFNEDGSINWRGMVKPEHLYPNKDWFELRGKPIPESVEGLADNQLLIKLGGLKELAKLRGYNQVSYDIIKCERDYVAVKCRIHWKALVQEESSMKILEDPCTFEDMANATLENTNDFCAKFLETIATNRAFVRCVRNYLGINIVGDDEIDKSKNKTSSYENSESSIVNITPQALLKKLAKDKLGCTSFEEFKGYLRKLWQEEVYKNEDAKAWNDFTVIPARECRKLTSFIK
jgi:hypothetical protein